MYTIISRILMLTIAYILFAGNVESHGYLPRQRLRQIRQCKAPNSPTNGFCVKFSQCQSAQLNYYYNGVRPAICANNPLDPTVCCSSGSLTQRSAQPKFNKGRSGQKNSKIRVSKPRSNTRRGGSRRACQNTYFPKPKAIEGDPRTFLIGGVPTAPGEFPYMAAIGWRKRLGSGYEYNCGGSLISPTFVLTAAHCASLGGAAPDVVRTGGDSLDNELISDIPIRIVHVVQGYNSEKLYNDIALIELSYASLHKPACLWTSNSISQRQVQAIGYGHTEFGRRGSKHLLKIMLNIFSNQECSRYYTPGPSLESGIINSQICAGDPNKAMDTCQGDSGGPILQKINVNGVEIPYVLGITAIGPVCASGPPSIYTRVTAYLNWIESIVWPSG